MIGCPTLLSQPWYLVASYVINQSINYMWYDGIQQIIEIQAVSHASN